MKNITFPILLAFIFSLLSSNLSAKALGKIDLGPAYIHIDVISMKHTIKELDMPGVRGDISYVTDRGWLFKATGIYGKEKDGEFESVSFSLGRCIPVKEKWIVTPSLGISYTWMDTLIHMDMGAFGYVSFRDRFKALAPFIAIEGIYNFTPQWRLCASIQYAWSHTHTNITKLFSSKSATQGPNYGLMVEYDINKKWSVNLATGYNESFSHERNGLRARGIKIGFVRWF